MLADDKTGNMREVFLEASKIREIEDRVNQRDLRQGPFVAELSTDAEAEGKWIIAITFPGQEGIAFTHLVGRRFGVLRPLFHETSMRRGRLVESTRTLFPNYLFVYVYDEQRHIRRILNCTGVQRILHSGDRPAIVPWSVINGIRKEENKKNLLIIPDDDGEVAAFEERLAKIAYKAEKKRRKKKRKNKKAFRKQALHDAAVIAHQDEGHPNDVVACYSWGIQFGEMPEGERIGALHKALGLEA